METTGNFDKAILGMGQTAGLIDKEYSVAEIIKSIMDDFYAVCKELAVIV
jgi:NAD(P)H-dependent flavin oxidoreductase YrpB (nitropropane dioxygenase family)